MTMKNILVSKGKMTVSSEPETCLEVESLGATLAICASDPQKNIAGIAVLVVPQAKPDFFVHSHLNAIDATRGLPAFFSGLIKSGASRENLLIWLVGASRFMTEPQELSIGSHLYTIARKILLANKVAIKAEHVGGTLNRSIRLCTGDDKLTVVISGVKEVTI